MIERLTVRTFKSLDDVRVELGLVNVFIGANGSNNAAGTSAAGGSVGVCWDLWIGPGASVRRPLHEASTDRLKFRSNVLYHAPNGRMLSISMRHPSSSLSESDYRARIARARQGIAVVEAAGIMQRWSIPVGAFAALLGVSERKWSRARAGSADGLLSPVQSDRLLRASQVFDHAIAVFDNDQDAATWFSMPNHALLGETPLSLMDTDAGVHQVDDVLTRLEFGVFA